MLSRRKYSRQSKSRSNRPRPVLQRRSSGRAHTSRRFPKRRTYKGTDTHLRGSKQLRFRPNDVEPVYGLVSAALMSTLDITGFGMFAIVISFLLIPTIAKLQSDQQYSKDLAMFEEIENQLKLLWDRFSDNPENNSKVWSWMKWIRNHYPNMTPDTKLTDDQLTGILTNGDSKLSRDDITELVKDFNDRPLKVFLYCMLTGENVANVPQLPERPIPNW